MPVYKLKQHKAEKTAGPELGAMPTTPAECAALMTEAYRVAKLADKTIKLCRQYVQASGERVLRSDETPWGTTTARTVQRYSATLEDVLALLVRCGASASLAKRVEAALIEQGVGSEKISERWEPWK